MLKGGLAFTKKNKIKIKKQVKESDEEDNGGVDTASLDEAPPPTP